MPEDRAIADNLEAIRARIAGAAQRSGRSADEVQLIAVSKTHPPEAVAEAVRSRQMLFGENRVQEARAKIPLSPSAARWHLIGHLQKNKAKQALGAFEMIQSVDSLELACALHQAATEVARRARILLEVNVAGEASKFGFAPDALMRLAADLIALDRLDIEGLMCIPPFMPKAEQARPYFERLRIVREDLETETGMGLPELSMGMSHDFEEAIAEGATMVRIGAAIFGERTGKTWKPSDS